VILIHLCYRQTDRQTDGRHAISIPRYALVHRAVKMVCGYCVSEKPVVSNWLYFMCDVVVFIVVTIVDILLHMYVLTTDLFVLTIN